MPASTLYARVEETIATEIAQGEYRPGDQLPTEDALLQRFQVSRITVRRAIQNLVSRGLLEIRRGLGTFVRAPEIEAELTKLTGFVEDMNAAGRKATARVVSQAVVAASARVAERLQLAKGTKVMQIKRVRLAGGLPISFDETYLSLPLGNNRGHVREIKKDHDGAIADATEAIRLDPGYTLAWLNRGIARQSTREYEQAKSDFSE